MGALACGPGIITPAEPHISVLILPPARTVLSTSDQLQLQAVVQGATDTRVKWSGEGVSQTGLFQSATPGTFPLVARSVAEPAGVSATLELIVVAQPQIISFTAAPSTVTAGETVQLSWAVDGARSVLLDGAPQTGTSTAVTASATQTFVLTATNEAGMAVTSSVTVTATPTPVIDAFSADHPAVTLGETATLHWTTHDAAELFLDGAPVTGTTLMFAPRTTQDHVLEARNSLGFTVSRTLHIEVASVPEILAFYSDRTSLTSGETTTVHWFVNNATELLLDGAPVSGLNVTVAPTVSAAHVLEARNSLGVATTATLQIQVVPAPAITRFAADTATLTSGESTMLRWETTAVSEVRLNGVVLTAAVGSLSVTPAVTTDYVLEAQNAAGYTVSQTVRVTVVPAPVITAFAADSAGITAGQSTTLRWTTTGTSVVRLDGVVVTGTSQTVSPSVSTDYVLLAANPAGFAVTQTVHVNVVPAPVIVSFTTDAASLTAGQSTTVRWSTTGSAEVRLDGVLVTGVNAAISPTATGSHMLEARNSLGFATSQTVTVTVVPAAVIASFTAARSAITQSESTVLSWSVSNAVTVLLNGAVVSGTSVSVSPSTTTAYTLEARNSVGSAVTSSLTLTVVPQVVLDFAASPSSVVVGTPSTLSWTAAGAATLTLNGATVGGTSLAVSPIRTTTYLLKATNSLGFETSQSLTLTVAAYPGTLWMAAGQVWLRWPDAGPLTGTQTYDVYRSTSPINSLSTATLVGRLFADDLRATRLKLADPAATWVLPAAAGGTTALAAGEAHFAWTPHVAETSFFAVVPSGSSTPQVKFGPIDETIAPVSAHVQRSGIDGQSGLAFVDYALWVDGRAGADPGRADFPVMGPPSFNGLATIFRVYASPATASPMPGLLVLHGNGGSWLDHHPAASNNGPDVRLSKGIVTAVDDAFAYAAGSTVSIGTTRWFGSWDGFDRFNPTQSLPPNGSMVHPYTLRRLLWIREWMIANRAVDPDRVLIAGHSMGALGAVTATRAYPDKFAGTLAYQCHTNVVAGFGDFLRGNETQNLPTSLGASIIDVHDPAVLIAPGDLPPMHIVWGVTDNMIPWADKPATIAQFSAAKRGHQIWWDDRTHGYPWTGHFVGSVGLRAESLVKLKRNQSYPAFSSEVSPDASTSNAWGTQGGYLEWDPDSIVDTPSLWSVELWLRGTATLAADVPSFATVTVDISIRRPQLYRPAAGAVRTWTLRRISDNAVLQTGALTVSPAGLVTASAVVIPKDPQRVRLSVSP